MDTGRNHLSESDAVLGPHWADYHGACICCDLELFINLSALSEPCFGIFGILFGLIFGLYFRRSFRPRWTHVAFFSMIILVSAYSFGYFVMTFVEVHVSIFGWFRTISTMTHLIHLFGTTMLWEGWEWSNLRLESEGEEGSELRGNCNEVTIDENSPRHLLSMSQ